MSERYKCEKCGKVLSIGQSYVLVHVEIADTPVADYHFDIECFRKSLKTNSGFFSKITTLIKRTKGGSEP